MGAYLIYGLGLVALAALVYVGVVAIRSYFRFYGTRLVTCPETKKPAAVALDVRHAATESILGPPQFRLSECSRWPEREGCGQECLRQIERSPEDCLVRNIVAKWYQGKKCVYCLKPFETVNDIFHHKPALSGSDRKTVEWDEIRPEKLPEVLGTSLPVCWTCHMVEIFRRERPDLVLDNPWQNRQGEWTHREVGPPPRAGDHVEGHH
jgi:hypothetical protein